MVKLAPLLYSPCENRRFHMCLCSKGIVLSSLGCVSKLANNYTVILNTAATSSVQHYIAFSDLILCFKVPVSELALENVKWST